VKEYQVVRKGPIAIVELTGRVDTRASMELERVAASLLGDDVRAVIVDLSKVEMLTSSGIRVLFKMRQHLEPTGRGLALCGLHDRVRKVLDIAGLLPQFRITATREQAMTELAAAAGRAPAAAPPPLSKLARLITQVLSDDGPEPGRPAGGTRSTVASLVVRSLSSTSD
jgi:anti-anti-sigma factor